MGKKDNAIVPFLKVKERFCDLFNGTMFQGRQVILPEELELKDSVQTAMLQDKYRKKHSVKRYRDIVMDWNGRIILAILACEVQENVHYAMPVRNMLYDSLSYTNQITERWDLLSEEEKKSISSEEFLSHFRKEDFLTPVITLVFYYGNDWDGNLDLHSMFNFNNEVLAEPTDIELLKKYIPNYHINLINPTKIKDLSVFKSDLQIIFGMLQCKDDKEKLFTFTKDNESYFSSVNSTTLNAIDAFLNFDAKLETILEKDEKEDKDMCKALDDWYNDGVEKGKCEGRLEGRLEGIQGTITVLKNIGWSNNAITDKLIELYNMNADEAKELIATTA